MHSNETTGSGMRLMGPPGVHVVLRVLLGLFGLGSFGTGVVAVFATQNGTGSAALLVVGAALCLIAVLGGRVETVEFAGTTLRLRAEAAEKFALAEELEQQGDTAEADRLREQAEALMRAAGPIAARYRGVRGAAGAGPERTRAMEAVVAQARRLAGEQDFQPAAVSRWLREGSDEERVTALAMMQARPEWRDFPAVVDVVGDPRSAFEHFQALRLANEMIPGLDEAQLFQLAATVRRVRGWRLQRDTSRWQLSELILRRIEAGGSQHPTR